MQETELTWADKLILEGREKGVVEGKRETLKRLLTVKFGPLPKESAARIDALSSGEELDEYLDGVLTADRLEDVGLQ